MRMANDRVRSLASPAVCLALENYDQRVEENDTIPKIGWEEIQKVSHLGDGASSNVFLVCASLERHNLNQYALKCLDAQKLDTSDEFLIAACNLAVEANILSNLKHKNIVQLRGVSRTHLSDSYAEGGKGYFILLDVLGETLKDRIRKWNKDSRRLLRRPLSKLFSGKKLRTVNMAQMHGRIEAVAMSVVSAMKYLHDNKIVLRDLKSENIGFDEEANVRLFDFGMARHVDDCNSGELIGTFRYMAPEIMHAEAYGFHSDVYSFGILLWEICTCCLPFEELKRPTVAQFVNEVACNDVRPPLEKIPCGATRQLIKECWDPDHTKRPSFEQICNRLRGILDGPIMRLSELKHLRLQESCRTITTSTTSGDPI
jgi:serine/threonine protein kinase